jgi:hypothetical protein
VDLQELRAAWGEEVYLAVVNCLLEIEECGKLTDRTIVPELWNYKENRKATRSECVEYMCSQVKRLNGAKGRTTRRYGNLFQFFCFLKLIIFCFMARTLSRLIYSINTCCDPSDHLIHPQNKFKPDFNHEFC